MSVIPENSVATAQSTEQEFGGDRAPSSLNLRVQHSKITINTYLLARVPEYRALQIIRQKGWDDPRGDDFFRKQRHSADNANPQEAKRMYNMMKDIGEQLHTATSAFTMPKVGSCREGEILDLCMAPGGFLTTCLKHNPGSRAMAYSLPANSGGHKVLLPRDSKVKIRFLDLTMLASDMGMTCGSNEHLGEYDISDFTQEPLFSTDTYFAIAICDGQVLRTHAEAQASHRASREARRLAVTQLTLALGHLHPGGSIVILLHRIEKYETLALIYIFNKFSKVQLYKPSPQHAKRSSFYMVATEVQSRHPEAIAAVGRWQEQWKAATFGTDKELEETLLAQSVDVEHMLNEFGPEFVELARQVWVVQTEALAKAPFIKDG